jgi:hypothetical protein
VADKAEECACGKPHRLAKDKADELVKLLIKTAMGFLTSNDIAVCVEALEDVGTVFSKTAAEIFIELGELISEAKHNAAAQELFRAFMEMRAQQDPELQEAQRKAKASIPQA